MGDGNRPPLYQTSEVPRQGADFQVQPNQRTAERTLLVSSSHFVFERINLAPDSTWCLEAERETWLLVLSGGAIAGSLDVVTGDAIFVQSDRVGIYADPTGIWWASRRTRAATRFRTCCSVSHSRAQWM